MTDTNTCRMVVATKEKPGQAPQLDRSITKQTFSHLLATGHDKELGNKNFRIVVPGIDTVREISKILSSDECNAIIKATSESAEGFTRPTAFSTDARDCQRIHTVDKAMSDIMMSRLKPYLPEVVKIDGVRWRLSRFTHHWRYVRYYPGGHFSPHYDGVKMSATPVPCMSVFTVQIYLNGMESFTGGSTRFFPDYEPNRLVSHDIKYGHVSKFDPYSEGDTRIFPVEPEAGKALVFNHALNTLHDGSAVIEGTKFIMRGDILYTAVPEDQHLLPTIADCENSNTLKVRHRHWCPITASKHGTRNHVGEVWYCVCATDQHGALVDGDEHDGECWHSNDKSGATNINEIDASKLLDLPSQQRPKVLILFSGKRAVGKDHIANLLNDTLSKQGLKVCRTALGNVNKQAYAQKVGIDVNRLMTDRAFKEEHRVAMINHHTQRNAEDPEWCLKNIFDQASHSDVLILSDLRTHEDLCWFKRQGIPTVLLRITATDVARKEHGWDPCQVKDMLHTETELDSYTEWTACWDNSNDSNDGATLLQIWIVLTVVPRIVSVAQ